MRKQFTLLLVACAIPLALLAIPAHAQTAPGKIDGQIANGTKDAKPGNAQNLSVRLFGIDASSSAHPFTATAQTDAAGKFSFPNIDTNPGVKYIATVRYGTVDYFSDALGFDGKSLGVTLPITIYEATSEPAAVQIQQTHFILDIKGSAFNVTQIIIVKNNTDRTFIGAKDTTLLLPVIPGAQNVQFERQDADQTTLRANDVMTYTLPFYPGSDQIIASYTVPFTPPNYQLNLKIPYDSPVVRLLVSDVGETITSAQFPATSAFPAQNGQKFLLSAAANVRAGAALSVNMANLSATSAAPATSSSSPSTSSATPSARPANTNELLYAQILGGITVLAFVGLLGYALMRQRKDS